MGRHLHDMLALRDIAHRIHASFVPVTNALPHTADLQGEIRYNMGQAAMRIKVLRPTSSGSCRIGTGIRKRRDRWQA